MHVKITVAQITFYEKVVEIMLFQFMLHGNFNFCYLLPCQYVRIPEKPSAFTPDNRCSFILVHIIFQRKYYIIQRWWLICVVFCFCTPLCLPSGSTLIYNPPSYPVGESDDVPNNELYRLLGKRC